MPISLGVVYPLWSFVGEHDERMNRLLGEVGVDHVTVPVITGPLTEFRFDPQEGPHYFHTAGGWHYPPNREYYGGSDVRPRAAEWVKTRNLLAEMVELVRKNGRRVLFRLDVRSALASLFPTGDFIVRNAWDESEPSSGACNNHSTTRLFLRGAIEDLLGYSPDGIELDGYQTSAWANEGAFAPHNHNAMQANALGQCFCAACRENYRIGDRNDRDAARAAQLVIRNWARYDPPSLPDAEAELHHYESARVASAGLWLTSLANDDRLAAVQRLQVTRAGFSRSAMPTDWRRLHRVGNDEPRLTYSTETELIVRREQFENGCGHLSVPFGKHHFFEPSQVVRFVSAAAEAGVQFLEFEQVANVPSENLIPLRQAFRFGHRTGS